MSRRRRFTRAAIVAAAGLAVAAVVAEIVGLPRSDAAALVGLTAAPALVVGLAGWYAVARLPRRSLQTQIVIVVVTAVGAVAAGVLVAAKAMFLSAHDRDALLVIAAVATAAALVGAIELASTFGADADAVARLTQQLGVEPANRPTVSHRARIKEMDDLAQRLEAVAARLDESRARERALERSRRELVAWISHDLRSPLASIRALAEALEDGVVSAPADVERYQRSIRVECERLSALVDDLFELSRLQAGAVGSADRPHTSPVVDLVGDARSGVLPRAEAKGVRIDVVLDDTVGASVVPAKDMLRILRNLLDNAVRHTAPGGTVKVEGRRDEGAVVVSVIDQCGGIPAPDLRRVFDVAFRGDSARQRDGAGGGLGLAIAKGLVEARAGSIDVTNHAQGCLFRVRIPTV